MGYFSYVCRIKRQINRRLLIKTANIVGGDFEKAAKLCEFRGAQRTINTCLERALGIKSGRLSPEYIYTRSNLGFYSLEGKPEPKTIALRGEINHPLVKRLVNALPL